jgi:hypothetical protein
MRTNAHLDATVVYDGNGPDHDPVTSHLRLRSAEMSVRSHAGAPRHRGGFFSTHQHPSAPVQTMQTKRRPTAASRQSRHSGLRSPTCPRVPRSSASLSRPRAPVFSLPRPGSACLDQERKLGQPTEHDVVLVAGAASKLETTHPAQQGRYGDPRLHARKGSP